MKIRYTLPALTDLDQLLAYVRQGSPQGARTVLQRIRATEDLLRHFPMTGRSTTHPTIRRIRVSRVPYLLFYEVAGSVIVIHAVRHGARDPSTMPDVP